MWLWLLQQWNDVKGNIKFAILILALPFITGVVAAVTHGLALWQQTVLTGVYGVLIAWAIWVTVLHHRDSRSTRRTATVRRPRLWVDYRPGKPAARSEAAWEALIFSKEPGDAPIQNIRIGPLVWRVEEIRPVTLHSVIGPIRTEPVECKFTASEKIDGGAEHLYELPDLLRQMMAKLGPAAQPTTRIWYEDFDGNQFSRQFVLSIDPWGKIVWDAGPVEIGLPPSD